MLYQASVNCVRFNEESTVVISGSVDTLVKIWDCKSRSQEPIQQLDDCKDSVTTLDVSDHEILVGSGDRHIRLEESSFYTELS
jgi:mitogen-activated protein kinase organizer 1